MSFPKYTEEHLLDFEKEFSTWGRNMKTLLSIPFSYKHSTKKDSVSKALRYFIYQNYNLNNNRFYRVEQHRKPEPQRTIMRIMSAPFEDLPLYAGISKEHIGVRISKVVSWRFRNNI